MTSVTYNADKKMFTQVLVIARTSTKSKQQVTVFLEYNSDGSGKITTNVTGKYQKFHTA